ncbi:hypothetical protein RUM44_002007 [Polyplax serrata]|uniref:Uncharacterized protein n=1 Tax=Polyplax serrata TaxID=468196 RepID=A0ABR1ALM8_POLSC
MKFSRIALTLGFIAVSITLVLSEEIEEYDYDDEVAAPQPQQPVQRGRLPLLSPRQNKGPNLAHNANKITKQSGAGGKAAAAAKAPPPVQEPEEEEIEEYDEAGEEPVEQISTEAPKKTIKPIVRPFRSNDDLLAALKRRRQQVQNSGAVVDRTTTTTTTTTASSASKKSSNSFGSNGRRNHRNGGNRTPAQPAPQDEYLEPEPVKKGHGGRKYSGKNASRANPAPVVEDIPVEEVPKPKFGRGSRRS